MQPGTKVTYIPTLEKGIVKDSSETSIYVVFNCGEEWDNYENYTAASCREEDLIEGWELSVDHYQLPYEEDEDFYMEDYKL